MLTGQRVEPIGVDTLGSPGGVASAIGPAGDLGGERPDGIAPLVAQSREPAAGATVLLVCSSGGHLAQMLPLLRWLKGKRRRWVTFSTADAVSLLAEESVEPAYHPTTRNLVNLARNTLLAWRVLKRDRPDLIVSTGAAVAFPFFVLGRLRGIPTVYIEVYDRLDSPTLTGRLCRPFATRMLVQWPEQQGLYRGATVVGTLL